MTQLRFSGEMESMELLYKKNAWRVKNLCFWPDEGVAPPFHDDFHDFWAKWPFLADFLTLGLDFSNFWILGPRKLVVGL